MMKRTKSYSEKENTESRFSIKPITNTITMQNSYLESSFSSVNLESSFDSFDGTLCDNINAINMDDLEVSTSNLNFKRRKSVRFDTQHKENNVDEPPKLIRKISEPKVLIPILKNNSFENSFTSINSASFTCQTERTRTDTIRPRPSILDDRINEKTRFETISQQLKKNKKKYTDDLFPPDNTSLCLINNKFGDVQWVRVSELHPGCTTLYHTKVQDKSEILPGPYALSHMSTCLAAINNNIACLEKIFGQQSVNQFGIYLLRLFVNGVWRYVIIDDYVPIVIKQRKPTSLFLTVKQNGYKWLEIWPYLVQKAYAKIFSTYQSLTNGNYVDSLNELTGSMVQKIQLKSQIDIEKYIKNKDVILLGQIKRDKGFEKQYDYQPIVRITEDSVKVGSTFFKLSQIHKVFQYALVCRISQNNHQATCSVKQSAKNNVSVRSIQLNRTTICDFSLIQKDCRFFRKGYKYSWARVLVVMRENDGYRWVAGKYCNNKVLSINCTLDPGKYFIVVMMDWADKPHDMHLCYNGTSETVFERVPPTNHQQIITETCVDLAQRFGELRQLAQQLCSYWYIDVDMGFIIDNINNESNSKTIPYSKSYNKSMKILTGLEAMNSDFVKNGNKIVATIKPKEHYTLIIKVKNGEDLEVLDCFGLDGQ